MLPDGELQKTCRLSPSNSKILAADLENKSRREKRDDMLLVQSKTVEVTDEGGGSESWHHFHKLYVSLTRYEVACCDGNISLHQCRISPVEKKKKKKHIWFDRIAVIQFQSPTCGGVEHF